MSKISYTIIPSYGDISRGFVDLDAASELSGMHPEMILEVARARMVVISRKDREGNPYFDDEAIYRLRQIEHLRLEQRAHLRTIRLIMQLMDRAEAAEREVRWLRDRVR